MTKFSKVYTDAQGLFQKISTQTQISLYIQNNILWFFSKVLCQDAQVGPIYIGQFHTKMLRISNARAK